MCLRNGDPGPVLGSLQTFRWCLLIAWMLFLFLTLKLGKEKGGEKCLWLKAGQPCILHGEVNPGTLRVRQVTLLPKKLSWGRQSSWRLRPVCACLHRETQAWCSSLVWIGPGWAMGDEHPAGPWAGSVLLVVAPFHHSCKSMLWKGLFSPSLILVTLF